MQGVRLKKESYRTMLACGTPDAVDRYRQAKQISHGPDGPGGKNSGLGGVREGLRQGTGEENSADSQVDPPRIQEEQCGFRPGRGTLDQLYTLRRVLEGLWEFAQPVHMCFVDLEKAFDRVPRGILWEECSANDVVLLASSGQDLQHVLERFAAECEAAGMRISTSKSEAMVLSTGKGWRALSGSRFTGQSTLPTLTYGHELWVMTERTRSLDTSARNEFPPSAGWLGASLRDRVRSSVTREELGVEPLLLRIERSQLRWLGHLFRMPPGRLPREVFQAYVPPGGGPGEDPGHAGETMSLSWLAWERLGSPPGRAGGSVWGEGSLGISAQTAASATRSRTKRMKMDGWMDSHQLLHMYMQYLGKKQVSSRFFMVIFGENS
ncbi:hypothetical protein L3Q82_024952 [Scortum barcoo]|uniref:Uncharacterized protein n=1 Tax=Scortum barcoo TaxID=214431 RepID=A0ACB8WQX4_9TELE|nr:hypothetical protein L3Q82_024952 [Scortum barcoo]